MGFSLMTVNIKAIKLSSFHNTVSFRVCEYTAVIFNYLQASITYYYIVLSSNVSTADQNIIGYEK